MKFIVLFLHIDGLKLIFNRLRRHFTKFDVLVYAKDICAIKLIISDINWFDGIIKNLRAQLFLSINHHFWDLTSFTLRLARLLLLLVNCLLLVLCSDLGVVLEDAFAFFAALLVFAIDTLTIFITRNTGLEALTVFLEAFALFTIATFRMPVLLFIANNIRDCALFVRLQETVVDF